MDISPLIVLGALTLFVTGAALAIAPPEKRRGFLLHITIVTALTAYVVTMK